MHQTFTPLEWSCNTNIYEVNLRQYTPEGTFDAFEKELPRLQDMGVEVLWFMPVTPISYQKRQGTLGSYYACSDYTAVNPEYGTLEDFRRLVKAAHTLGMKVIIDWVANHTGWDHRWTWEHPEYYRRNYEGNFYDAHGWIDVIDLNFDNPEMQKDMIAAMRFWLNECDIDGFRCDMAMLVPLSFWRAARIELDEPKKLFWLAECEEIDYHQVFDASYGWKFLHKMEAFWRNETGMYGLNEVLHYYNDAFPAGAFHLLFTTNHDENSHSGSEYDRLGNAAEAFAVLCCTWNGLPLIYSGQELPNYKRLKFFDKDVIEWKSVNALHEVYKKLLLLRKNNPALQAGDIHSVYRIATSDDQAVFAFMRRRSGHEVLVLLNLSHDHKPMVTVHDDGISGSFTDIFNGTVTNLTAQRSFALKPWAYRVLEKTV